MIKEAIGLGATFDEAKENAIAALGASEFEDIQFEVISMPKKKVLGLFGGNEAKVRAFVEVPDVKPQNKKSAKQEKKQPVKKENTKAAKPAEAKPAKTKPIIEYGEPVAESEVELDSPAGRAIAYIKPVLDAANCGEVKITVAYREGGAMIILEGDDLSIAIGRRGETLDALQYLASLAANNGGGHYRISLNIGNYREKREETLSALANRIAAQVLKTGKNRTLEPMNPYERRIIHTAIQGIEGVTSVSFGEGQGRRVVIAIEGSEIRPQRFNDRRRNNSRRGGAKPNKTVSAPAREPKRDSDIPLYGKIN